jgi:DNA-binding MarR family transcriptional regulator
MTQKKKQQPGTRRTKPPQSPRSYLAFRVAEQLLDMYPWLFRLAKNAYRRQTPREISATQLKTLLYVVRHGGTQLRPLAHDLGISMAVASTSVSSLATQGLVRIAKPEGDRRQIALWATLAGRAIKDSASELARGHVAEQIKGLSPNDLDRVHSALELLSDIFLHAQPVLRPRRTQRAD